VKYLAAPWSGQKTGAFLDQRENRALVRQHTKAGGRALDLFTYHGSFALHLAHNAKEVVAVDQSAEALARGRENARLNGIANIEWREENTFDLLRELERRRERFDTIVLDPPAFAKTKANIERAVAGYKEVNLRAMKISRGWGAVHLVVLVSCDPRHLQRHAGRRRARLRPPHSGSRGDRRLIGPS